MYTGTPLQVERLKQERELETRLRASEEKLQQQVAERDQQLADLATEKERLEERWGVIYKII